MLTDVVSVPSRELSRALTIAETLSEPKQLHHRQHLKQENIDGGRQHQLTSRRLSTQTKHVMLDVQEAQSPVRRDCRRAVFCVQTRGD